MRDFDYCEPTTLDDTCALLHEHGDEARLIAGGVALMLALRQRIVMPSHLISLQKVEALRGIRATDDGGLCIGAFSTHTEVATSPQVQAHAPTLARLAAKLANAQVRHQGTFGGNLCYADPSTDPPGCLLALGAEVTLHGPQGARRLPFSEFLVDYYETALQPDEVLVGIHLPAPAPGARTSYLRHLRTLADHRPVANVSVHSTGDTARPDHVALVVAAATPLPWSSPAASLLTGQTPSAARIAEVAAAVADEIEPLSDTRCSADYRREVVRVLTARALRQHFELAEGAPA